jgi:hypothetical protein
VLAACAAVSLGTAHVGGWPVGPVLIQLAAFPAFTGLGYVIGWFVDHPVGPLLAAAIALLAAYTDYGNYRWPLGFMSDGGEGSWVGQQPDSWAVLGRLAWCTALSGLAVLAASWRFAAASGRWIQVVVLTALLVFAVRAVQTHPRVWTDRNPAPLADHCTGEQPRVCVLRDYAGLAGRTARIVDRTAALLRSAGARGLPETYVGWWPSAAPPGNEVFVVRPGTAYEPAAPLLIASDVVAPTACPQWQTGEDLDRVSSAQQLVLTWLVRQDPSLSGRKHVTPSGADVNAFLRLPDEQQRVRVAALATAMATCRFSDLPRQGSPM